MRAAQPLHAAPLRACTYAILARRTPVGRRSSSLCPTRETGAGPATPKGKTDRALHTAAPFFYCSMHSGWRKSPTPRTCLTPHASVASLLCTNPPVATAESLAPTPHRRQLVGLLCRTAACQAKRSRPASVESHYILRLSPPFSRPIAPRRSWGVRPLPLAVCSTTRSPLRAHLNNGCRGTHFNCQSRAGCRV